MRETKSVCLQMLCNHSILHCCPFIDFIERNESHNGGVSMVKHKVSTPKLITNALHCLISIYVKHSIRRFNCSLLSSLTSDREQFNCAKMLSKEEKRTQYQKRVSHTTLFRDYSQLQDIKMFLIRHSEYSVICILNVHCSLLTWVLSSS